MDIGDTRGSASSSKQKLRKFGYKSALTVTDNYVAKKFGPQMPLMVAECLSQSLNVRENSTIKFNDSCGWSWLVSGRKLFVWPLAESGSFPDDTATIVGKDLMLPSSDLAYNADLAIVFRTDDDEFPSCLAVSPEGVVRYWPTLRAHRDWIDVNSQLGGEEVCTVLYIPPLGCLAITTSASIILIEPRVIDGVNTVIVQGITDKHTWLGTFGKKMSALLGYVPAPQFLESSAIKAVARQYNSDGSWSVVLLAEHRLQVWIMEPGRFELSSEYNLEPVLKNAFSHGEEDDISWEIYDLRECEHGQLMVLAGCKQTRLLVSFRLYLDDVYKEPKVISMYTLARSDSDALVASTPHVQVKFLPTLRHTYLFTNQVILAIPFGTEVESASGPGEIITFHNSYFLGGGFYADVPVFFSSSHSFISVSPINPLEYVDSGSTGIMSEPIKIVDNAEGTSPADVVKAAFKEHVKKNVGKARSLIATFGNSDEEDSTLATVVVNVSLDIINQASSNDPRMPNRGCITDFSMSSLNIERLLEQKERAHAFFVIFVDEIISKNVGLVSTDIGSEPVKHILADHHERIIAMRALYKLKSRYSDIIGKALKHFVQELFPDRSDTITEEFFFTHTEYVYSFLESLCSILETMNRDGTNYETYLKSVSDVNVVLTEVITTTVKMSEKKNFLNNKRKFISSLCLSHPYGLYDSLREQNRRTRIIGKDYGVTLQQDKEYLNQLFSLTDIILFTQKNYMTPERFSELSSSLIEPFLDSKLYEQALMLSDKYVHFPSLVKACIASGDNERIDRFIHKYGNNGFCEELFKFYVDCNMKSQLLELKLPAEHEDKLKKFLDGYPNIGWAYSVKNGDYNQAFETLMQIGTRPNDFALRKSRILSIAKLARELSDIKNDDGVLDRQLELLSYQEILPDALLEELGFPPDKEIPTFTPSELIKLFVSPANKEADRLSYKASLEILSHVQGDEKNQLWMHIWQRAAISSIDSLLECSDKPEGVVGNCLLFQIMETVISSEDSRLAEDLIPKYETLISFPELVEYTSNPSFLFVLRYGYETCCEAFGIHVGSSCFP